MSSRLDDDTARTVQRGRATLGALLSGAQRQLQKVFIGFVVGLVGTILALRAGIWSFLRNNTKSRMPPEVLEQFDVITRSPFDVILIQVKVGLFVGIAIAVVMLVYFSRDALRERGYDSMVPIGRRTLAGVGALGVGLFAGGVVYAYGAFFPFVFDFLAGNAINAAVKPSWDIVMYVQFLLLLTLSFGLAAEMPLAMTILAYTEVVPYETFRDRWRIAFMLFFLFGAFLSPPDPLTQIMWGLPLVVLYIFSLGLAKLVTNTRRAGTRDPEALSVRRAILGMAGVFGLVTTGTAVAANQGGLAWVNSRVLPQIPATVSLGSYSRGLRPAPLSVEGLVGFGGIPGQVLLGVVVGAVVVFLVLLVLVVRVLRQPVEPPAGQAPSEIDVGKLDADGVRAAPPEPFLEMDEDEAVELAQTAIQEGDKEKAQAILDRFDELEEERQKAKEEAEGAEESDPVTETAAGVANAFTDEETTEEDIGGYYYDATFILQSLTSKAFRILGVFMIVMAGSFFWLYQGGLGEVKKSFFSQIDPEVLAAAAGPDTNPAPEAANYIVALHPVEQLIFEVKVSVILGILVALPLVMYYAWPAMKERGVVSGGHRGVFLVWGGILFSGALIGSLLGFFYIAPTIISYLVQDALAADMVVTYRLKSFFWLVIFTTVGIGLLADIPLTMILFDQGGIVSYERMRGVWRGVVFAIFVATALLVPGGALTMLVVAIPVTLAYGAGLAILWAITLPRRFRGRGEDIEETSPA